MFEERRAALIHERRTLEDTKRDWEENRWSVPEAISRCVELAKAANSLYQFASIEKRRSLLKMLVSNCTIRQRTLNFVWQMPFREIADREKSDDGRPSKEMGRTEQLIGKLVRMFTEHPDALPLKTEAIL
jgi:hypothetical protein